MNAGETVLAKHLAERAGALQRSLVAAAGLEDGNEAIRCKKALEAVTFVQGWANGASAADLTRLCQARIRGLHDEIDIAAKRNDAGRAMRCCYEIEELERLLWAVGEMTF